MSKVDIQGILVHKQIHFIIMVVVLDVGFKILCMGWAAGVASEKNGQGLPSARYRLQRTIRDSEAPQAR